MEFIRGQAIVGFPFGLVKRADGSSFIDSDGTPSVFITIDGGTQFAGFYTPSYEGNGQWTVNFNGNETDGDFIGIIITHSLVIPEHFTVKTTAVATTVPIVSVTVSSAGTSISDTFEYYGTLVAADLYFDNRLNSGKWEDSTIKDRQSALITSTRLIDRLNFANIKNVTTQRLQFPRGDDVSIPVEIEYAAYEIAIKLLEGTDLDIEVQTLGILSETYSGVRSTYDGDFVNEHFRAGIPSIDAWEYLKPYLLNSRELKLSRVN